ncbi:lipoyl(octanoyl) transferase LipB [uncultured Castellaniella sp.]|uniref:lipoyl(octanoyl) transferase LipB n=1 Tax=uncultured Castellaniella sp. TaxID=647907 RepID=UPI002625A99D|nr:lipoyl(octanoyl) transferase LipB [uncultured Castellaniella sp.]
MRLRWLDRPAAYLPVWQAMQDFTEDRRADTPDELWLVEHAPVYTLGQAGLESHILNPHGIPVVHCNRGGQVTYHGPGQVVLYTLVDLRRRGVFVRDFVTLLEQSVLDVLADLGVSSACRKPGAPGIYVPQSTLSQPRGDDLAKIAALGIKVRRGCAYHGVALNVDMDLDPFSGINPCGYAGLQTVDLRACGVRADLADVGERLAGRFSAAWETTDR